MSRKTFLFTIVLFLSCALPFIANAAETIKLGVVGPHSGDLAGYGIPSKSAVELIVEEVNGKGGLLGKQIELIPQDEQCKPDLGINAATKLIADNVDFILGPVCSGATRAALPLYTDKKVLTMSPSATGPELTQSGQFPYFFRTTPSDDAQAKLGADFIAHVLKVKKVALLHDKSDYGKGYVTYVKDFLKEFDPSIEIVYFDSITPGAVDYSAAIQKVGRSKADILVFGGYYPEASKLIIQVKSRKLPIKFLAGDGVQTKAFVQLASDSAEGVYASGARDYSSSEVGKKAIEAHEKKYGAAPGQFFMQAYAGTQALLNAIEKAGTTNVEPVMQKLHTEYVETPIGNISFDSKGDVTGAGFVIFQVQNGQFVEQSYTPAP